MSILDDQILQGTNVPPVQYLEKFIIEGMSESVEDQLKSMDWDGRTPTAAVLVHYNRPTVTNVQIQLVG